MRLVVLPGFTGKRVHSGIARTATVFVLCCAAALPAQAKHDDLVVKIESGLVKGTRSADYPNVAYFLGIPYAAPPVGALRWKPPQLPSNWRGVRKADQLSPACPQTDRQFKFHSMVRAGTELTMNAPSRWLAEATSRKSKAYLYHITWSFSTKGGQQLGAFHGIDMVLLFQMRAAPWDRSADAVAQAMRRYWIRFAETGDPNTAGLVDWPAYDSTAPSCLEDRESEACERPTKRRFA